jgi:uncharacterized heparinase superfamily protein
MIADSLSTRARLKTAAASRAGRQAWRALLRSRLLRWRYRGQPIDRLLLMPQDLRTGDPSFASEIYHGHFGLAGTVAVLGTESPFAIPPPNESWERELHGFGWLRHLRAAHDEISREHARVLVRDWMRYHGRPRGLAWEPDVTARRIISWLSHSSVFVEGADEDFYDQVMRSFALQVRYLRSSYRHAPEGIPRLTSLVALSLAGLCADDAQPSSFARLKQLIEELKRQILSDGGHVSRNPGAIIEILLDLLPLRQCYVARDQIPPQALVGAIDRMMPMLRFFRLGSQGFAHFNGMGQTPMESLAALMVHDDVRGVPVSHADKSGYCRLDAGKTVLVVDTGRAPPGPLSAEAHAGCLAFEMHTGAHPLIVNCGVTTRESPEWRTVARATAAHSTVVVSNTSSAQFLGGGPTTLLEDKALLTGPVNVQASLRTQDGAVELRASHDGYDTRYGITHIRRLKLTEEGDVLTGTDQLIAPHGLKGSAKDNGGEFAVRFHLHPAARAELSQDGTSVLVSLPDNDGWRLAAKNGELLIEESVFLADPKGPRGTSQIIILGSMGGSSETNVHWVLGRVAQLPERRLQEEEREEETAELPLDE